MQKATWVERITQEVLIEIIKPYQQASLLCVSSAVENKSKSHLAGRMECRPYSGDENTDRSIYSETRHYDRQNSYHGDYQDVTRERQDLFGRAHVCAEAE